MTARKSIAAVSLLLASLPARSAQASGPKFVDIGDARLAYVGSGRGEPVVLVHGGLQDYRMWSKVSPILSKHYRVIAYSRRNHYPNVVDKSGWPDTAADLHAHDLASLVTALKLGRVILIAHSSGAHAALFFVAAHPELVRARDLVDLRRHPAAEASAGESYAILRSIVTQLAGGRETGTLTLAAWSLVHGYAMLQSAGLEEPSHEADSSRLFAALIADYRGSVDRP